MESGNTTSLAHGSAEIIRSLRAIHSFTGEQVDAFLARLRPKRIAKKDFLLKPGQTCNFMAFITRGSFRFYAQTEMDEPTLFFFTENLWVADYESLIAQQATQNFLQAVEDTEIMQVSLDDIHQLMEQYPVFRSLTSLLSQWVIPSSHYISISGASPDERYRKLLSEHPDWINRFAQMHLASYLGMTKETFSRVKARVR